MSTYRIQAFVLNRYNAGERDAVVRVYSSLRGTQSLVAKSLRATKSKLRPFLEPFREVEIMIARGRSVERLVSVASKKVYSTLARDVARTSLAFYIIESILHIPEDTHYAEIFHNMKNAFTIINDDTFVPHRDGRALLNVYSIQLLTILGMRPECGHCCACRIPIDSQVSTVFHPESGGILHEECARHITRDKYPLSSSMVLEVQKILKQGLSFDVFSGANIWYNEEEQEKIFDLLALYWHFRLERPMKSKAMIPMLCPR